MLNFGSLFAFKKQAETPAKKPELNPCLKFVVIGDSGVGKSRLLLRYASNRFHEDVCSTIGACFLTKRIEIDGRTFTLQLWDTSGQERYQSLSRMYFRGANCVLFCFDLSNRKSFEQLGRWLEDTQRDTGGELNSSVLVLIGCKSDLKKERAVTAKEAEKWAREHGVRYFETSAKLAEGVDQAFLEATKLVRSRHCPDIAPEDGEGDEGAGWGDDEELFEANELNEELTTTLAKAATTTVEQSNSSREKKISHKKTDVNVFTLKLSSLADDGQVLTGDPAKCSKCFAIYNSYSSTIEATPSELEELKKQEVSIKKPSSTASNLPVSSTNPNAKPSLVDNLLDGFRGFCRLSNATTTTSGSVPSTLSSEQEGKGKERDEDEEDNQHEEMKQYWKCEFCGAFNQVDLAPEECPTSNTVDYIIAQPLRETEQEPEIESNVVFCIDISGSMCCTTEVSGKFELKGAPGASRIQAQARDAGDQYLPGQRRDVTYVSRLQCVQAAVAHQMEQLCRDRPKTKVGLVTFNNDVTLLGDGTQDPQVVTGDKLHSFLELVSVGEGFKLAKTVAESKDKLLETLWNLEEAGATALGPALILSIAVAGQMPASKVILCTDGLANKGIGSLEGKNKEYSPIYVEMAESARVKGVAVSVISLADTACALENLSIVAEQTSGVIEKVDPLQLTKNFSSILSTPIIATEAIATVILHRGLMFRNNEEAGGNLYIKDLGNVTKDTEYTFSYGFVPKSVFDLSTVSSIPFQVQLIYKRLNGTKCMRVVSTKINVTDNRQEAEEHANARVIGTYAAQQAGRYAKAGDYEKAQMETRAAQRFLARNVKNEAAVKAWTKQVEHLDKELRGAKQCEVATGDLFAHDIDDSVRVGRQANRAMNDHVSTAISKTTVLNSVDLFD